MRIFKTLWFNRFAKKEEISDQSLVNLVVEMNAGQLNADLGGGVYKQRLARRHSGKSGGFRLLVCFRQSDRAFFTYGFPKSARANISVAEKEDLKKLADILLNLDTRQLDAKVAAGAFLEITREMQNGQNIQEPSGGGHP